MGKYKRLRAGERWSIIQPIIENQVSINSISTKSGVTDSVVREWVRKYQSSGMAGLQNGKSWKQYPSELKLKAIEDVLVHGMSLMSVIAKYEMSTHSVLSE